MGPKKVPLGDKVGLNRAEGVAVARLRTNNSLALRAYRAKIQLEADSTCTGCDDGVLEDNEHLLTGAQPQQGYGGRFSAATTRRWPRSSPTRTPWWRF